MAVKSGIYPLAVFLTEQGGTTTPPTNKRPLLLLGSGQSNMCWPIGYTPAQRAAHPEYETRLAITPNSTTPTSLLKYDGTFEQPTNKYGPYFYYAPAINGFEGDSINTYLGIAYAASAADTASKIVGGNFSKGGSGFTTPGLENNLTPKGHAFLLESYANKLGELVSQLGGDSNARLYWIQGENDIDYLAGVGATAQYSRAVVAFLAGYEELLGKPITFVVGSPTQAALNNATAPRGENMRKALADIAAALPYATYVDSTGLPAGLNENGFEHYSTTNIGQYADKLYKAGEVAALATERPRLPVPAAGFKLANWLDYRLDYANDVKLSPAWGRQWNTTNYIIAPSFGAANIENGAFSRLGYAIDYRLKRPDGTPYYKLKAKFWLSTEAAGNYGYDPNKVLEIVWEQNINPLVNIWGKDDPRVGYKLISVTDTTGIGITAANADVGPFRVLRSGLANANANFATLSGSSVDGRLGVFPTRVTNYEHEGKYYNFGRGEITLVPA